MIGTATKGIGYPMLIQASYAKGTLYVLTIPDNFGDLYKLPPQVLNQIRTAITGDLPVRIEGPSQIGLFAYDNGKFIVENFVAPGGNSVNTSVIVDKKFPGLVDVVSGQRIAGQPRGEQMVFEIALPPASYRVFSTE
jgi:hypothetical protein